MTALDVMGVAEIARRLGVDPRRAATITRRRSFPRPCAQISLGRVWRTADVEAWAIENWPGPEPASD